MFNSPPSKVHSNQATSSIATPISDTPAAIKPKHKKTLSFSRHIHLISHTDKSSKKEHAPQHSRTTSAAATASQVRFVDQNTAMIQAGFSPIISELKTVIAASGQESATALPPESKAASSNTARAKRLDNLSGYFKKKIEVTRKAQPLTPAAPEPSAADKFRLVALSHKETANNTAVEIEQHPLEKLENHLKLMQTINAKPDRRLGLLSGSVLAIGLKGEFSNSEKTAAIRTLLAEIAAINLAEWSPEEKAKGKDLFGKLAAEIENYINSNGNKGIKDKTALLNKVQELKERQTNSLELVNACASLISAMSRAADKDQTAEETIALKEDQIVSGKVSSFSKKQIQEGFDRIIRALLSIRNEASDSELLKEIFGEAGKEVSFAIFAGRVSKAMKAAGHHLDDTACKRLEEAAAEISYFSQPATTIRNNLSMLDLISGKSQLSGYFTNILSPNSVITLKLADGTRVPYSVELFRDNTVYNLFTARFEQNYEEIKTAGKRKDFFAAVLKEERRKYAEHAEAAFQYNPEQTTISSPFGRLIVKESGKVLEALSQINQRFQAELYAKSQQKHLKQIEKLGEQAAALYKRITCIYDIIRQLNSALNNDLDFDLQKLNNQFITAKFNDPRSPSSSAILQFASKEEAKQFAVSQLSKEDFADLIMFANALSQMSTLLEASTTKTFPACQDPNGESIAKASKHLNHSLPLEVLFKELAEEGLRTQAAKEVFLFRKASFESSAKYVSLYNEAICDGLIEYGVLTIEQAAEYKYTLCGHPEDPIAGVPAKNGLLNAADTNTNPIGVLLEIEACANKFSPLLGNRSDLIKRIQLQAEQFAKRILAKAKEAKTDKIESALNN